jgi:hypothetical protein
MMMLHNLEWDMSDCSTLHNASRWHWDHHRQRVQ